MLTALPAPLVRRLMRKRYERMIGGGHEPELAQLPRIVRRDDLALDVGSNLGIYTYALSRLAARVIAFEPIPLLARFVAHQRMPGVTVERFALSTVDGGAALNVPRNGAAYASLRPELADESHSALQIATRRLDGLSLGRIGFIKIDVEGHEEAVLIGGRETIARDRPRLLIEIEERHNAGGLARIVTMLDELGYACRFFRDGEWHPFAAFDLARDQDPALLDHPGAGGRYINNFLFLPEGEELAP